MHPVIPCQVCPSHNPQPVVTDSHHIKPESWAGPSTPDNLIQACPTAHHGTHAVIDLYVALNRKPTLKEMRSTFGVLPSKGMRDLAARAWAQRPEHPTRTSITWGHSH